MWKTPAEVRASITARERGVPFRRICVLEDQRPQRRRCFEERGAG